jgi:AraC-like DNA-binding protein
MDSPCRRQELEHVMSECLTQGASMGEGVASRHHLWVVARLEELRAANPDRSLSLNEICAAIGVSERTLRTCCQEHLGIGPIRYLWLRRMHLVQRALAQADPATTTVTAVATDFGFWELGRFSVAYRKVFGESPSTTLRRPCNKVPRSQEGPSARRLPELHSRPPAASGKSADRIDRPPGRSAMMWISRATRLPDKAAPDAGERHIYIHRSR